MGSLRRCHPGRSVATPMAWVCILLALAMVGCDRDEAPATPEPARQVVAAAKPTGPLPPGASCVTAECHATLAGASHVHAPVKEGECASCHGPDAGGHTYPLKADLNETCMSCHDNIAGTMTHQHAAMEQGCGACHEPHAAATRSLLKADTVEHLCQSCHQEPLKRFAHEPFARGQCAFCHESHQADNRKLLKGGTGSEHCLSCHSDVKSQLADSKNVHEAMKGDCMTCHSPHSTEYEHVLKTSVAETCGACHEKTMAEAADAKVKHDAMTTDASCLNCHSGHASAQPKLVLDRQDKVCLTCHASAVKTADGREITAMKPILEGSRFLHGGVKNGECASCHNAHGSGEHSLLTGAFPERFYTPFKAEKYELCFTCHDRELVLTETTESLTGFRDGRRNLHYLHVNRDDKGRSCKSCHESHGSDLPNHMASEVPFEGSNWAMQVGYEKQDDGGTCSPGCHAPRDYSRNAKKPGPTTRGAS